MQRFVARVGIGTEFGMPLPGRITHLEIPASQFFKVVRIACIIAGTRIGFVTLFAGLLESAVSRFIIIALDDFTGDIHDLLGLAAISQEHILYAPGKTGYGLDRMAYYGHRQVDGFHNAFLNHGIEKNFRF